MCGKNVVVSKINVKILKYCYCSVNKENSENKRKQTKKNRSDND